MAAFVISATSRLAVRLAIRNITANSLRSALSLLGVTLGVASLFTVIGSAEGARKDVERRFAALGTGTIIISARELSREEQQVAAGTHVSGLTTADADAVARLDGVTMTAAERTSTAELVEGSLRGRRTILAAGPESFTIRNVRHLRGRTFSPDDVRERREVVILTDSMWKRLGEPELGSVLRFGTALFHLIGVCDDLAPLPNEDVAAAAVVEAIVPLGADRRLLHVPAGIEGVPLQRILVATDGDADKMTSDVEEMLVSRHGAVADFVMLSPTKLIQEKRKANRSLHLMLLVVAATALCVGGIGIANVMLAGVAERKREIGVHRSLGASTQQILRMLLIESTILSVAGGVVGACAGAVASAVLDRFTPMSSGLTATALAVLTSVVLGMSAGIYPAVTAAAYRPVDLMRM